MPATRKPRPRKPPTNATVLAAVHAVGKKVEALMQELLSALAALKSDREAFVLALQAEFTKLEGEITNPAALDEAKKLVDDEDAAVKAFVIPTA